MNIIQDSCSSELGIKERTKGERKPVQSQMWKLMHHNENILCESINISKLCLNYLEAASMIFPSFPLLSPQTLVDICRLLPETKVPELVVSLVALAVLIVVKEVNDCYRQKLPLPIPIELIVASQFI